MKTDFPSMPRHAGPVYRPMYRDRFLTALLLLCLIVPGCGLFDDEGEVSARSDGIRVTVRNGTDDRIYFAIFGRELATLIDWIPHLDEEQSVSAGSSRLIPHSDIMKEEGETQAIFYWWKADVRNGDTVPGTLTSTIIDL